MPTHGVTRKVAEFTAGLRYEDLPAPVIEKARVCLLDYFGYAMYGCRATPINILFQTLADGGPCTVVGRTQTVSPLAAAFVNGAMGHVAEMDDTHRLSMAHLGDSVIPVVLAVAEATGADARRLIQAMVAGYDVAARAGEAVMPSHYYRGWHPSGSVNTLGTAAAAGNLLGLSVEQMQHALGVAGTQITGNFAHMPERGMVKDFNPGRAAFSGLLAARLAQNGFTGATDFMENPMGLALFGERVHEAAFLDRLGSHFKILEVSHKVYAACRHIHSAIDAALEINARQRPAADAVETVEVASWSHLAKLCDDPEPWRDAWYGPRFSTQFNVAVALVHGEPAVQAMFDQNQILRMLDDARVREIVPKIRVTVDRSMDDQFPTLWPARVTLVLKDGQRVSVRKDLARGEPEVPVGYDDIVRKFRQLGDLEGMPGEIQTGLIEAARRLPDVPVKEVTRLLRWNPPEREEAAHGRVAERAASPH
ncbi:MAG: MmgE/PrpD family protein [Armatimonadetes bacterium]|nr:MmgE/PrpD family protein [Armatimonadota bacterium]